MPKLVVIENLTLDGVMQAPGRPDEDTRDGFAHGGWAIRTDVLNRTHKYVASNTLAEPLPWEHSTLLPGDAADAVAALKRSDGPDIGVLGSGALVQALMARGLVDEYLLSIHPLVLGGGRRLFADGGPHAALTLADSVATTTGVVIATYRA